jgi:hypothetical protein
MMWRVAVEQGWPRRHPLLELDRDAIRSLLGSAVLEAEVLTGGRRNTNYRLRMADEPRPVVLRLYTADPAACAREVALWRPFMASRSLVRAGWGRTWRFENQWAIPG